MHLNKGGKFAHLQGIFEEGKKGKKLTSHDMVDQDISSRRSDRLRN